MLSYRICYLFYFKKYFLLQKLGSKKIKKFFTLKLKKYYFEGLFFKKKFGNFKQVYF